jgi:hypothetical protein
VASAAAQDPVRRPAVKVAAAERLPCTRAGIATSVMAFVGLVHEARYVETSRLWVRRRLPTPAYFRVVGGRRIRADEPAQLPTAVRTWRADRYVDLEVRVLNPRISRRQNASSGYGIAWTRTDPGDGSIRFGKGKGVWDCATRRIAQFFGHERAIATDVLEEELELAKRNNCGRRGSRVFPRYGQIAWLCNPVRSR